MKTKPKNAYTLTELVIVTVIVSILAGFALPSYKKMKDKQREREAILIAKAVHGALTIYRARNGEYWDNGFTEETDINVINTELGTNIVEDPQGHLQYSYQGNSGNYLFRAHLNDGTSDFCVDIDEATISASNPCCGNAGGGECADDCQILPRC